MSRNSSSNMPSGAVETFGVDGWRIDTYIYCSLPFMNKCNSALIAEYPQDDDVR